MTAKFERCYYNNHNVIISILVYLMPDLVISNKPPLTMKEPEPSCVFDRVLLTQAFLNFAVRVYSIYWETYI